MFRTHRASDGLVYALGRDVARSEGLDTRTVRKRWGQQQPSREIRTEVVESLKDYGGPTPDWVVPVAAMPGPLRPDVPAPRHEPRLDDDSVADRAAASPGESDATLVEEPSEPRNQDARTSTGADALGGLETGSAHSRGGSDDELLRMQNAIAQLNGARAASLEHREQLLAQIDGLADLLKAQVEAQRTLLKEMREFEIPSIAAVERAE